MSYGYIHSIESFGTVDGPGIRLVVFMQGCPMRCLYCHNPDTWEYERGTKTSPEEIISLYLKNRPFYKNGGITVTGGEPLLQAEFLTELFKKAKEENIHTCIDSSGITYSEKTKQQIEELLEYTDLVMLDIKHIDSEEHKRLTGCDNKNILEFAEFLDLKGIDIWIRHIIVEGFTDNPDDLRKLGEFIGKLKNLKALDVLPYHTMGVNKYKELGIKYSLEGMEALPYSKAVEAKNIIIEGIRKKRAASPMSHS